MITPRTASQGLEEYSKISISHNNQVISLYRFIGSKVQSHIVMFGAVHRKQT